MNCRHVYKVITVFACTAQAETNATLMLCYTIITRLLSASMRYCRIWVIGARLNDDNGLESGSAYVFTRDTTGLWSEQAKFLASDGAGGDRFGWSVSVSGDTALIGAPFDRDNGSISGSAYVFKLIIDPVFDPVSLTNDLMPQVMTINLQKGISNRFDTKLISSSMLNVLDDVNENNDVEAVNSLKVFIHAVEAQIGGHLIIE